MASSLPVLQIVPRLGAQLDGVADYAKLLGTALDAGEQVRTSFLSGDPQDSLANGGWRSRSEKIVARSASEVVSALGKFARQEDCKDQHVILLHYVNYGYAPRGCPFWLISGVKRWKWQYPHARLVAMFHELYAFDAPWRSSFWLSPVQQYLAREILRISDHAVTNVASYRRRLCDWLPARAKEISLLPVFSSVGEPIEVSGWSGRRKQLVVLGRSDAAFRVYGRWREHLLHACRMLQIENIIDIGPRTKPVPTWIENIRVSALGHLPAENVGAVLGNSRAGFLDYPSDLLGKSTVFAAYAAHGLVPLVSWRRGDDEPGLAEGVNYSVPSLKDRSLRDFESIANGASAWYAGHRLNIQAREFAKKLCGSGV